MIFKGYGVIWDKENNCPLCEFKEGMLDTTDLTVIKKLSGLGYKGEGELPKVTEEKIEETQEEKSEEGKKSPKK